MQDHTKDSWDGRRETGGADCYEYCLDKFARMQCSGGLGCCRVMARLPSNHRDMSLYRYDCATYVVIRVS